MKQASKSLHHVEVARKIAWNVYADLTNNVVYIHCMTVFHSWIKEIVPLDTL